MTTACIPGAHMRDEQRLDLARGENAKVLMFDVRANELPSF